MAYNTEIPDRRDVFMSKNSRSTARHMHPLLKLIRFLLGFAGMLLVCGFAAFILHIYRAVPPNPMVKADGIVVLTGKGGGRLNAGAQLLKNQYGERLLVSGVNPAIDAAKMRELLQLETQGYNCCVDLDYEAEDTVGNGEQTANWARALGYETIILVTSDYHMPRAKVEIAAAMDGIKIIAYPVKSATAPGQPWWGGTHKWNRLLREYGKLLISYAREPGARANFSPSLSLQPTETTTP